MKQTYGHVIEIDGEYKDAILTPEPSVAWDYAKKHHGARGSRTGPPDVNRGWEWLAYGYPVLIHAAPVVDLDGESAFAIRSEGFLTKIVLANTLEEAKEFGSVRPVNLVRPL